MIEAGHRFPPWERRPAVDEGLAWMWEAWVALQTCRPIGMAMGPIPWTAIHEYAVAYGVTEFGRFEYCMRALDREWFVAQARRKEKGQHG